MADQSHSGGTWAPDLAAAPSPTAQFAAFHGRDERADGGCRLEASGYCGDAASNLAAQVRSAAVTTPSSLQSAPHGGAAGTLNAAAHMAAMSPTSSMPLQSASPGNRVDVAVDVAGGDGLMVRVGVAAGVREVVGVGEEAGVGVAVAGGVGLSVGVGIVVGVSVPASISSRS